MLGEKKSRKRVALLTMLMMLVASVFPTGVFVQEAAAANLTTPTAEYPYQYKEIAMEGYRVSYDKKNSEGSYSSSNTRAVRFRVLDTRTNTSYYTYCCDLITSTKSDSCYDRTNIENSGYFDAETARKIRSVVECGYPGINNDSLNTISSSVSDWISGYNKKYNKSLKFNTGIIVTDRMFLTATQVAIWTLANTNESGTGETRNLQVYSGNGDYYLSNEQIENIDAIIAYLLDTANTAPSAAVDVVAEKISLIARIDEDSQTNTDTLSGSFAFYSEDADETSTFTPDGERTTIDIKAGTESVISGTLKSLMNQGIISIEDGRYIFEKRNLTINKTSVITATVKQNMSNAAYFYKTAERGYSQNFVGLAEWTNGFLMVQLDAVKELVGAALEEDQFEFVLSEKTTEQVKVGTEGRSWNKKDVYEDRVKVTEVERQGNDVDGRAFFSPIMKTSEGIYTYIVSEVVDNDNEDIIYDESVYEVEFEVVKNDDGTYDVVSPTITKTLNDNTSSVDNIVFTNEAVVPETTAVTVTKVWDDADNLDGSRPESVAIQLKADDENHGDTVALNEANNWTYTWTELPESADGSNIIYTVEELNVPTGYTATVTGNAADGYIITNTHVPVVTEVSVAKVWDDADNQDGIRPESVKVQLKADGNASGAAVTLNAENNWTYEWTELAKMSAGEDIKYTVEEVGDIDGYTSEITGSASTGYTVKNTHATETIDIEIEKLWEDLNNIEGLRSDEVEITLKADGEEVSSIPVSDLNEWNDDWEDLPKYANGKKIEYTISVDGVPDDYETEKITSSITENGKLKFTVKSKYVPRTSVVVNKVWDDADDQDRIRPESVQVQLFADGEAFGDPVMINEEVDWTYTWENLLKYSDGNSQTELVRYTVEEVGKTNGYTSDVTGDAKTGFIVTNTHTPETTEVDVTKVWNDADDQDGIRPENITVQLLANGEVSGKAVTISAADKWKHTWTELDKYDETEKRIKYTVDEVEIPEGYTKTISGNAEEGFTITNTHVVKAVALDDSTDTGDDSCMLLWAMMLLTSLAIMILILVMSRKRNSQQA